MIDRVALAEAIGAASAGHSNVLSCLFWAFENYSGGSGAYDDPDGETANALLSIADVALALVAQIQN